MSKQNFDGKSLICKQISKRNLPIYVEMIIVTKISKKIFVWLNTQPRKDSCLFNILWLLYNAKKVPEEVIFVYARFCIRRNSDSRGMSALNRENQRGHLRRVIASNSMSRRIRPLRKTHSFRSLPVFLFRTLKSPYYLLKSKLVWAGVFQDI